MTTRGFLSGMAIGAGLAYFLDRERGGERRRRAAERLDHWIDTVKSRSGGVPGRYGSRLGDLAGLEAANLPPSGGVTRVPGSLLAVAGAALALYGLTRRGGVASAARTVGAGLLAGTLPRTPAGAAEERRRVVDIQKSLYIDAPVAHVYAFWDSYESFPLFMSNIREIEDLGGGRSRWIVNGPGGLPIEWETVLTARAPGEMLAWRSEPGSMLDNAGVVRFTPEGGGTRVDLRLCYQPPEGGAGRAVAELLGADPRDRLNHDLGRLKALLEGSGRSEVHGQEFES